MKNKKSSAPLIHESESYSASHHLLLRNQELWYYGQVKLRNSIHYLLNNFEHFPKVVIFQNSILFHLISQLHDRYFEVIHP